jgi:hypothetical protein
VASCAERIFLTGRHCTKHHEGLFTIIAPRQVQVAITGCVMEFSLPAQAYREVNSYQIYFLEAPPASTPDFLYFENAYWDKDKKVEFVMKQAWGFELWNRDPLHWLYIPVAQDVPYPGDPSKVILFLHEVVTDPQNTMYSPIFGTVVEKSVLENISRVRLIEHVFSQPIPSLVNTPDYNLGILIGREGEELASGYALKADLTPEMVQKIQEGSQAIKYNLFETIQKGRKKNRYLAGMFMMENNKRIVMFDLFGSSEMLEMSRAELGENYARYALERSYYPVAQYIAQAQKPGMAELVSHLRNLLKDVEKKGVPGKVIRGRGDLAYEFRQVAAAKRIGFYFALGSEVFHIHLCSQKD